MDDIFFKVFKNIYLRSLIFLKIKQINKSLLYTKTYNYYQFPLLSIIKTKNQHLLIEKIKLHNNTINNNNNNNNNNSNKITIIENENLLKIDEDCLKYLFKWKRVDSEIVKLIFKTFENEIQSLKINDNRKYFQDLIENENIEILKLFLLNSLPYPLPYLQSSLLQSPSPSPPPPPTTPPLKIEEERNRVFKSMLSNYLANYSIDLFSNPTYPMEQVIEFFNFLSSLSITKPPLITNRIICTILIKIVKENSTNLYGKFFIEKLEKPSIIGGYQNKIELIYNLTSISLEKGDRQMIKLLILKIVQLYNIDISSSSSPPRYLFEKTEYQVKFNKIVMDLLDIDYLLIYKSNSLFYGFFDELVIKDHQDNREFQLPFPNIIYNYSSSKNNRIIISDPHISLYLLKNHLNLMIYDSSDQNKTDSSDSSSSSSGGGDSGSSVKNPPFYLTYSSISNNKILNQNIQLFSNKQLRWDFSKDCEYIGINQLKFLIKFDSHLFFSKLSIKKCLLALNDYQSLELLINQYSDENPQTLSLELDINVIKYFSECNEIDEFNIFNLIIPKLLSTYNNNNKQFTSMVIFKKQLHLLLLFSSLLENDYPFNYLLQVANNSNFFKNNNQEINYQIYITYQPYLISVISKLNYQDRIIYIDRLKRIKVFKPFLI
ncbi:hypothetical protein ACTFIR_008873 [Dictyostelium discoideum]